MIEMDYKDENTIKEAAAELSERDIVLDTLVNCGGIVAVSGLLD